MHRRNALLGLCASALGAGRKPAAAQAGVGEITPARATIGVTTGVMTGATIAAASNWSQFSGQRVGLITNQTGRVGSEHLVDALTRAPNVKLVALYGPEHGVRGTVAAGAKIASARDSQTGVPMFSLYGATRRPTPDMLRGVDVLVFDIQDVGVRSYTYISTMGLAMQAAAAAGIPFVVLDRPNPLGGLGVAGFVLEPAHRSFVGQYPIPVTHGMTVGELAAMIKGERWLTGLHTLQLSVVRCAGWTRDQLWPSTGLPWVATSPNIPTFASALTYPGIGMVGNTLVNEGCGTPAPFTQFGAPWLSGEQAAANLNAERLPGVRFEATAYTPQGIAHVAPNPHFRGQPIGAVRLSVTDVARYRPVDVGVHVLVALQRQARTRGVDLFGGLAMFHAIAGTRRLHQMVAGGASGREITTAWDADVAQFQQRRQAYLAY
jgi:uncharacterized protein YbbC (DUF1343 family)